ncbi:MAG: ATP-dependent DNA helicase RecQ [Syntrophus sp. PtaB.Bin075]|nr:MAG: ATP-dependent DNA helicase RecQ [Syntrophus sp. PtaB.Bin075]
MRFEFQDIDKATASLNCGNNMLESARLKPKSIVFFDIESDSLTDKILDIGCFTSDGDKRSFSSPSALYHFVRPYFFACGHNILNHDLRVLKKQNIAPAFFDRCFIDTLFLSPLLFPQKPHHNLNKDYKIDELFQNDPVNDARITYELLVGEIDAFLKLAPDLQRIFFHLLKNQPEFSSFFKYLNWETDIGKPRFEEQIKSFFRGKICVHSDIANLAERRPIELAYSLSLIHADDRSSLLPPWVVMNYPAIFDVLKDLRLTPCADPGCIYCRSRLNHQTALREWFGFEHFKEFDDKPLQEEVVKASLAHESLLSILPTGGGKSMTFQLPALMIGQATQALTVVISPLQSLMKDQVDNLRTKGIEYAVTMNGLLSPLERQEAIERVESGATWLLYIAPESLRSKTIHKLLAGRSIARFVIDEAHCFSSWGHDFRVDYLYIGEFIREISQRRCAGSPIPVSCFTATAKPAVIEDIKSYFQQQLGLLLTEYTTNPSRKNLTYQVFGVDDPNEKYPRLRDILECREGAKIVYVARTKRAEELARKLREDHFRALPFHGRLDRDVKTRNQDAFIRGEADVIVATSAFGMGVDKKDVEMVVHYEISDSLENYIQEAGRAGRDPDIHADCYILFHEDDLNKHFTLLNQTKLTVKEVQDVWTAIKKLSRDRRVISQSTLEIARKAGWDEEVDRYIETRITTAIAALEDCGYVKRGINSPRVYATSIRVKTLDEALDRIRQSQAFTEKEKEHAVRVIKKLFSYRKTEKKDTSEEAETRVDHLADVLGLEKGDVLNTIYLLRQEGILADYKDLTAFIRRAYRHNGKAVEKLREFADLERALLKHIHEDCKRETIHLKEINENLLTQGLSGSSPDKLRSILNYWEQRLFLKKEKNENISYSYTIRLNETKETIARHIGERHQVARAILEYLIVKSCADEGKDEVLIEFSTLELKEKLETQGNLFIKAYSLKIIEDALLFLHRMQLIRLEGGFFVLYSALTLERLEENMKKRFTQEDFAKLDHFYESKREQIHIAGEYARKLIRNYQEALTFVEDYFSMPYDRFLNTYFPGERKKEIKRTLTTKKFNDLFGRLSIQQLKIVNDRSQYAVVNAGPGSGKTMILVCKMASLLLMEEVKSSQLLMLTFSRAAALEFRKRLQKLVGNTMLYVEINTFHSFCFNLTGRQGLLERAGNIISDTLQMISQGKIPPEKISNRSALLIDEAQDMSQEEYKLVQAIIESNPGIRVILVGDDDQNIYDFRGSSSRFLQKLAQDYPAQTFELVNNYRSDKKLVEFSNHFISRRTSRLKKHPIMPVNKTDGFVSITGYDSHRLIIPTIADVKNRGLQGTTCIMTQTNHEAVQVYTQLKLAGINAQFIQGNEQFALSNLAEVRYFNEQLKNREVLEVGFISENSWNEATEKLKKEFHDSSQLEASLKIIRIFETQYPKKFFTDWQSFITEIKFEDVMYPERKTIWVSTIHKTKGREFDNVFMMLQNFVANADEKKRVLYVGFTRAKHNLIIHYNGQYLDDIRIPGMERRHDIVDYPEPDKLILLLGMKDVFLGYFSNRQGRVSLLKSGAVLTASKDSMELTEPEGKSILRYSNKFFSETLSQKLNTGYRIIKTEVNYVVYWHNEQHGREFKVVLPKLTLEKQ